MNFITELTAHLPKQLTLEELQQPHLGTLKEDHPQLWAMLAMAAGDVFDTEAYLAEYDDVQKAHIDPIQHYVLHGLQEGRKFPLRARLSAEEQIATSTRAALELLPGEKKRPSVDEFYQLLEPYDVISLDIFDTALLRKVEFPKGIFALLALKLGWGWFNYARVQAEKDAREISLRKNGHTEITIQEIYDMLAANHGLEHSWMEKEIELEKKAVVANPYILEIYNRLKAAGKKVIFCSDMYLPPSILAEMLQQAGYTNYDALYVSNELKLHKGDGSMQKRLLEDFAGQSLIHVGDNKATDIDQSRKVGLTAIWHEDCRMKHQDWGRGHVIASILNALLNNLLNTGMYKGTIHYSHGYRCGGPIAAGYCQHINNIAKQLGTQKILFLGRDCFVIKKVYDAFYGNLPSAYVEASRVAMLQLSSAHNADYLLNCFVFRHWDEQGHALTLDELLVETGYGYLAPLLSRHDLNRFEFCSNSDKSTFRKFFLAHLSEIQAHNQASVKAAKKYLEEAIGDATSVIVADLGWSCTCLEGLNHFVKKEINPEIKIAGTAICASQSDWVADAIHNGKLYPYLAGPGYNNDIHYFFYDANPQKASNRRMALEYLFTSSDASLLAYKLNSQGRIEYVRDDNEPDNKIEIEDIQQGIYDFNKDFTETLQQFDLDIQFPAHVAFSQLNTHADNEKYINAINANFYFDSCTLNNAGKYTRYQDQFRNQASSLEFKEAEKYVLLTSPEMAYTGALYALLRTALAFRKLGLEPIIWTEWDGPFRKEFEKEDIAVFCVKPDQITSRDNLELVKKCQMAFCNTILSDKFVLGLRKYLPVAWVIHEAQNLPTFTDSNPERLELMRAFNNVWCVSPYARDALGKFTSQNLQIFPNSIPDEAQWGSGHISGSEPKIRFAQLGTIEYRKGYDIALNAWKLLPQGYKDQAELHFAGRFIASAATYTQWLFQEMEKEPGIIFHGEITDPQAKIQMLSNMDVVLVPSRDESCSLVALEGAMLAKPLIVSGNVGAAYMVTPENGVIVETGNARSLAHAMIEMIDKRAGLAQMGKASRAMYENKASIKALEQNLARLVDATCPNGICEMSQVPFVVISLTSYKPRLPYLRYSIESLLKQDYGNFKIELWLSEEEFPFRKVELPEEVLSLQTDGRFDIMWCKNNLGPHKKYLYTVNRYPDNPVILVDDDIIYDPKMVSTLMESYKQFPQCISCNLAHVMQFNNSGQFSKYENWPHKYKLLNDHPSFRLLPIGAGGVLYPPRSLPEETFNEDAIRQTCLYGDDLWLKMMASSKGIKTVRPQNSPDIVIIEDAQENALWLTNVLGGKNDSQLQAICKYLERCQPNLHNPISEIRDDIF